MQPYIEAWNPWHPRLRADFRAALTRMSPAQRAWLHTALGRVHPNHDWISATE